LKSDPISLRNEAETMPNQTTGADADCIVKLIDVSPEHATHLEIRVLK